MIVVDTNVLAYRTLPGADPGLARLARQVLDLGPRLLLPSLWRHEFLNTLASTVKAGYMDLATAEQSWVGAVALAQDAEAPVDMMRALQLSQELRISGYDAQFLALAEAANTVLVTEDKRLRLAAGKRARSMAEHLKAA